MRPYLDHGKKLRRYRIIILWLEQVGVPKVAISQFFLNAFGIQYKMIVAKLFSIGSNFFKATSIN
jgi:hypothetical protein